MSIKYSPAFVQAECRKDNFTDELCYQSVTVCTICEFTIANNCIKKKIHWDNSTFHSRSGLHSEMCPDMLRSKVFAVLH